jgi:uncharacterized protein (TIGR00661 family)
MKILYGVQGTGNGHISRASAMAEYLQDYPEIEVTWLLSGRDKERGCGGITTFEWREGFTFVTRDGSIQLMDTLKKNSLTRFWRDINELDLKPYDLVISDYEPVISHAARRRGIPVTGIGHQYAFRHDVPTHGRNPFFKSLMQWFAPANTSLGLHWHHFDSPILPPIVDIHIPDPPPPVIPNKVIIYLPFENPEQIKQLLAPLKTFDFYVYHPEVSNIDDGHIHLRAISRLGFKQDLLNASSVVTNSGFELISECLQMGKRILAKPLFGQLEQLANAAALKELGYAEIMQTLDGGTIASWLSRAPKAHQITYPNVAKELAAWIAKGCRETDVELSNRLWAETKIAS